MKSLLKLLVFLTLSASAWAHTFTPTAFTVSKGDILSAVTKSENNDLRDGYIVKIDPSSGAQTILSAGSQPASDTYNAFTVPTGAILLEDGNVLVADRGYSITGDSRGKIMVVHAYDGSTQTVYIGGSPLLFDPFSLTIDSNGRIYVADSGCDVSNNKGSPNNCDGTYPATIYRLTPAAYSDGAHKVYGSTLWTRTLVANGGSLSHPYGITTEADGSIVVVDTDAGTYGKIIKINPLTGAQTVLKTFGSDDESRCPFGITTDTDNQDEVLLFTAFTENQYGCGAKNGVYSLNVTNSSTVTKISNTDDVGWHLPFGVIDVTSGKLIVIDEGHGNVYRVTPGGQLWNTFDSYDDIAFQIITTNDSLDLNGYNPCDYTFSNQVACNNLHGPDIFQSPGIPVLVDENSYSFSVTSTSYNNQSYTGADGVTYSAGRYYINCSLTNGNTAITNPIFFKYSTVSNAHHDDRVISADNHEGEVGDIQTLAASLAANETITFTIVMGIGTQEQFTVLGGVYHR